MKEDLFWAGVTGQAAAVADGEVTSRELVEGVLERIQRYDGALNAFTVVMADGGARGGRRPGLGDR